MDTAQPKKRLLLVDGDPKSLRVLDVSLKKAGFEVTTASGGRQALGLLETATPDLIISDTDLDEMDGFELCRHIKNRAEWNNIPFLFVSGRKSIEDKIRGLELGVDDYLCKPIYIREIGVRVRTALQRAERERMESLHDGRTRFAGDLADMGVVDLLQTIELNRKSGIVHIVNRDNRRGSIFFRDGRVIDAEVGRLSGANAVYRLFSWSDGRFTVEFKSIRRHDLIATPMTQLLMEGMRRLDETTRLLDSLPPLRTMLEVDCPTLADQLGELPDEMNSILRLCDGTRTLQEILEDSEHPDLEALTIVTRLYAGHIVIPREAGAPAPRPGESFADWSSRSGAVDTAVPEEPARPDSRPGAPDSRRDPASPPQTLRLPVLSATPSPPLQVGQRRADSSDDSLSAALLPREQAISDGGENGQRTRSVDTLKGVPIDSLFADSTDAGSAPAVEALDNGKGASLAAPPGHEQQSTSVPGLAERLLAVDPGWGDAGLPAAAADVDGVVLGPAMAGRNTREYGSPEQAAALLVEEVVSGAHEAQPGPLPAEPSRPSREVDWGEWPTAEGRGGASPGAGLAVLPAPSPGSSDIESPSGATDKPPAAAAPAADAARKTTPWATADKDASSGPAAAASADSEPVTSRVPFRGRHSLGVFAAFAFAVGAIGFVLAFHKGPAQPEPAASPRVSPALATPKSTRQSIPAKAEASATPAATPARASVSGARAPAPPSAATASPPPADAGALRRTCQQVDANGKGKAKAVAVACRAALEADPTDVDVMAILARAELDRGHLGEAKALAKKVLALAPARLEAYIYLGNAEQEAGKLDEARAAYRKYLELAPNGPFARELRAILSNL